ncbi:MAG: hypothetical protein R3336_06970, partial [Phycisphaeraceae bacterium]|nr:hypothetical protein [Phycisphaeraceae bacterium]
MSRPQDFPVQRLNRVLLTVGMLAGLAFLGLLARVIQLQVVPDDRVVALTGQQVSRSIVQARRGRLLDRQGRTLAVSRPATRLFIDPAIIDDPGTFAEKVAWPLGYDPAEI